MYNVQKKITHLVYGRISNHNLFFFSIVLNMADIDLYQKIFLVIKKNLVSCYLKVEAINF